MIIIKKVKNDADIEVIVALQRRLERTFYANNWERTGRIYA